ncbi:hypothetical protein [Thioclava sp. GXIMD4216]|uniref:Uncharacterized protein n=1 Tax=Thioclava litoralis TaxID=3076557 RepID=A0ABZ1DXH6_9RHOB|nr:hypothetical protein RPE78_06860 [Thioclava sp. FTW29]
MRLGPKKVATITAVTALAVALPVTVAMSKVDNFDGFEMDVPEIGLAAAQADPVAAPQTVSYDGDMGRPMDEPMGPIYGNGDLSMFDEIQQIGDDQATNVPYCDKPAALTRTLDHDFAEKKRMQREIGDHRSIEFWASDIMGTWTAVYNRADGVACVLSSGMGWERGDSPVAMLENAEILPVKG